MKNTTKTILFASLIAAMILPFSVMEISAAPTENASDKAKQNEDKQLVKKLVLEKAKLEMAKKSTKSNSEKNSLDMKIKNHNEQLKKIQDEALESIKHITPADRKKSADVLERLYESNIPLTFTAQAFDNGLVIVADDSKMNKKAIENAVKRIVNGEAYYELSFGTPTYKAHACVNKTDDCDPIIGGVKITGEKTIGSGTMGCSLGTQVKKGSETGFITAGHCFENGADVKQPNSSDPKIGEVTQNEYTHQQTTYCDCEYIKKTTSTTSTNEVWISSGTTITPSSAGNASYNNYVIISGFKSYDSGQVKFTNIGSTDQYGTLVRNMMFAEGLTSLGGDSGGSIINIYGSQFQGTNIGNVSFSYNGVNYDGAFFMPWNTISSKLGVSYP